MSPSNAGERKKRRHRARSAIFENSPSLSLCRPPIQMYVLLPGNQKILYNFLSAVRYLSGDFNYTSSEILIILKKIHYYFSIWENVKFNHYFIFLTSKIF